MSISTYLLILIGNNLQLEVDDQGVFSTINFVLIKPTFGFVSVQVVVLLDHIIMYTRRLAPNGVGQETAISNRDVILRPGAPAVKRKTRNRIKCALGNRSETAD